MQFESAATVFSMLLASDRKQGRGLLSEGREGIHRNRAGDGHSDPRSGEKRGNHVLCAPSRFSCTQIECFAGAGGAAEAGGAGDGAPGKRRGWRGQKGARAGGVGAGADEWEALVHFNMAVVGAAKVGVR